MTRVTYIIILLWCPLVLFGLKDTTVVCSSNSDYCLKPYGDAKGLKDHPYGFLTPLNIIAQLINPQPKQAGIIWYQSQNIDPGNCFDFTTNIFFSDAQRKGIEGAAFIMSTQISSNGPGGSQLGIPSTNSIAIVIDTRYNPGIDCANQQVDTDYLSIIRNGDLKDVLYGPVPINDVFEFKNSGALLGMRIFYDAVLELLQVSINDYLQINLKINLSTQIFNGKSFGVGFSAASGETNNSIVLAGAKKTELIRYQGFCAQSQRKCGVSYDQDYNNWIQLDTRSKAQWRINNAGIEQNNPANGPSFILSPNEMIDVNIQFKIVTRENDSGGLVGIVVGAKTNFSTTPIQCANVNIGLANQYNLSLLSWKPPANRSVEVCGQVAPDGFAFSRINTTIGPGCGTNQENQYFWQNYQADLSPTPVKGNVYNVQIQYTKTRLLIIINSDTIVDQPADQPFQPGRIGLFCHKQVAVFSRMEIKHPSIISVDENEVCTNAAGKISINSNAKGPDEIWVLKIDGKKDTLTDSTVIPSIIEHKYTQVGKTLIQLDRTLPSISKDCTIGERINVTVADPPLVSPKIKTDTTLCDGAVILFTIQDYTKSYLWQDSTISYSHLVNKPGIYSVRALDHACQASIKVKYAPTLSLTLQVKPECEDQSLAEVRYTAKGGRPPYQYLFEGNIQADSVLIGSLPGQYHAEIKDSLGCQQVQDFEVEEIRKPQYSIQVQDPTCYGDQDGKIILPPVPNKFRLLINGNPANGHSIERLSAGTYHLTWQDLRGYCSFQDSIELIQPQQLVILPDVIEVPQGQSVQLSPGYAVSKGLQIKWQAHSTLSCTDCPYPTANPVQDTRYQVSVYDPVSTCKQEASILVKVIDKYKLFVPNAFSPNGDGKNDYWYPQCNYHSNAIRKIHGRIVSPWGNVVFDKALVPNEPLEGWDGRFNGTFVNGGIFLYTLDIEYIDGRKERKTNVLQVIR